MLNSEHGLILVFFALIVSSGCVMEDIDEDGSVGKVLDKFGDFSEENGTTTYEFSIDSLTDNSLMRPMQDQIDSYKKNMSAETGMELESSEVRITEMSSNRAEIEVTYIGKTEDSEMKEMDVTFTFVKENGQWQLQNAVNDRLGGMPKRSEYQ